MGVRRRQEAHNIWWVTSKRLDHWYLANIFIPTKVQISFVYHNSLGLLNFGALLQESTIAILKSQVQIVAGNLHFRTLSPKWEHITVQRFRKQCIHYIRSQGAITKTGDENLRLLFDTGRTLYLCRTNGSTLYKTFYLTLLIFRQLLKLNTTSPCAVTVFPRHFEIRDSSNRYCVGIKTMRDTY